MKRKKIVLVSLLVVLVIGTLLISGINFYNDTDDRLEKRFLELGHGKSINTLRGEVHDKIKNAEDSVVLWGKAYHVSRDDEDQILLFGTDTLEVCFWMIHPDTQPSYDMMTICKR